MQTVNIFKLAVSQVSCRQVLLLTSHYLRWPLEHVIEQGHT